MHIDANSAFLSWNAVDDLKNGAEVDIRTIPSVVGGDESSRHGIVLAKSTPAKKFGIVTGEPLVDARRKCPGLLVVPAKRGVYTKYSNAMYNILQQYSPTIERFSIDECFLDYTASERKFGPAVDVAYEIKDRIKNELGFTVNIGVSCNKLLAKMGSDLQKPDRVHTLFPDEIEEKMWPLPVGDLFMVGRSSAKKLVSYNIKTIGDLAHADKEFLKTVFKSHGVTMWEYANGIDYSKVVSEETAPKGVGNSHTIDHDVKTREEACKYLLGLCEKVSGRLRAMDRKASQVSVTVRTKDFINYSHQLQLSSFTNSTNEIYKIACELFDECWHGEPIRLLGVSTSDFDYAGEEQMSLFGNEKRASDGKTDQVVDAIRNKFGDGAIMRGTLINKRLED